MLAIELTLLTGRYVATAFDSRSRSEWPPHPARLFSALVATHSGPEVLDPSEREVLRWLEGLGAPSIAASAATEREVVQVFVPVNDVGVLSSMDDITADVQGLRDALADVEMRARSASEVKDRKAAEKEVKDLAKKLAKAEARLAQRVAEDIAVPTKQTKEGPGSAAKVLPEWRTRQPRTFPSSSPEDPRVTFIWSDAAPTAAQRNVLDALCARVVRIGHSSSLVSARLVDSPPRATWVPSESGHTTLRIVRPGQLDALTAAFERHRETEPRVMPALHQPYDRPRESDARPIAASGFADDDWIVLRRVGGPALVGRAAVAVAKVARRCLMSFSPEQPAPEVISGHAHDGAPSDHDHLAIVPLHFVGSRHADGAILGIALVLPRGASELARRQLFQALRAWEDRQRKGDEDAPVLPLHLGELGVLDLVRVEDEARQATLRASTWCGPARRWLSATPVALDRNPGDLRTRDARKLARALEEAAESIVRGCERIGLPAPASVELPPAAPLAGGVKAQRFPPFRQGGVTRVLTHVGLTFDRPVRGPILVGAGRYHGLGLFRPVGDIDE